MLLSVVMPVYNAEKRLEIAVGSVLSQTWRELELILVDDGSKDASGLICDRIAASDPRVTVVHQSNAGVSVARNRGMEECRGDHIAFIDADDTIDSLTYEQAMRSLMEKPVDIYMFGMSFDYYDKDRLVRQNIMSFNRELVIKSSEIGKYFFELYDCNYLTPVWNKLYRTAVLKQNGIQFNEGMAILEDFKFCLDTLQHCSEVTVTAEVFYRFYHDLRVPSFSKRPAIDYMNNFRILDKTLRELADFAGLNDDLSAGRINAMILRYYVIAIEKYFSGNLSYKQKMSGMKSVIQDSSVRNAIADAKSEHYKVAVIIAFARRKMHLPLCALISFYSCIKRLRHRSN